jgi:hypothetical protein
MHPRRLRLPMAQLLCAATLMFLQSRASAQTGPLVFGNGSVISHPHLYITFWGLPNTSGPTDPNQLFPGLSTMYSTIGGWDGLDVLTQYSDAGHNLYNDTNLVKGTWTDTGTMQVTNAPYSSPASLTQESVLAAEAIRAARFFAVEDDPDAVQLIITGADSAYSLTGCAHHNFITDPSHQTVPYLILPYTPQTCGFNDADHYYFFAVHELTEALTNPRFDGWGPASSEVADKCSLWGDRFNGFETTLLYSNLAGTCFSSHPYYQLEADDRDSRRFTSDGDWSPANFKAECGSNARVTGVSLNTNYQMHSVLCVTSTRVNTSTGRTLDITVSDARADTSQGDWDAGYRKAECAANEVVSGIARKTSGTGAITTVRCAAGQAYSSCQKVAYVNGDNRLTQRNGDWAKFAFKNECGIGQTVKGVSIDPATGKTHALLCCTGQY